MIAENSGGNKNYSNTFSLFGLIALATIVSAGFTHVTLGLQASGTNTTSCIDSYNRFSIKYPSSWSKLPGNNCTLFSPTPENQIIPNQTNLTYLRISVANFNVTSICDLANNVKFFTNPSYFQLLNEPTFLTLNGSNAFEADYMWIGSPHIALPFVNQFSTLATSLPPAAGTSNSTELAGTPMLPGSLTTTTTPPLTAGATTLTAHGNQSFVTTRSSSPQRSPAITTQCTPQVSFSNGTKSNKFPEQLSAFYIIKGSRVYVIEYNAPAGKFNDNVPTVRGMISSFAFLP